MYIKCLNDFTKVRRDYCPNLIASVTWTSFVIVLYFHVTTNWMVVMSGDTIIAWLCYLLKLKSVILLQGGVNDYNIQGFLISECPHFGG